MASIPGARSAKLIEQEAEVDRILRAFKLNPYDILDLPINATDAEIKKQYRKKSLLIHPDKFKHDQGMEAFDLMKKAEAQLSDPLQRSDIDSIMNLARTEILKRVLGAGYSTNVALDDPRLQDLKPSFDFQLRTRAKELFAHEELAKRKRTQVASANEGAERARMDEEIEKRKRKAEDKVKWEEGREERAGAWREYSVKTKTKKQKKTHILG